MSIFHLFKIRWLSLSKPPMDFSASFEKPGGVFLLENLYQINLGPLNILNILKALLHHFNRLGIIIHQDKTPAHFLADRADSA